MDKIFWLDEVEVADDSTKLLLQLAVAEAVEYIVLLEVEDEAHGEEEKSKIQLAPSLVLVHDVAVDAAAAAAAAGV